MSLSEIDVVSGGFHPVDVIAVRLRGVAGFGRAPGLRFRYLRSAGVLSGAAALVRGSE